MIQYGSIWLMVKAVKSCHGWRPSMTKEQLTKSTFKRSAYSFCQMNVVWWLRPGVSGIVLLFLYQVIFCLCRAAGCISPVWAFELPSTDWNVQILTFQVPNVEEKSSVLHISYVSFSHSRCTWRGVLSLIVLHAADKLWAHPCGLSFTAAPKRFPLLCVWIICICAAVFLLHIPEPACKVASHENVGTTSFYSPRTHHPGISLMRFIALYTSC